MSEDLISSVYPPPPVFYKYFTDDNLARFEAVKSQGDEIDGELKLLEPPVAPTGTHYRGYGNVWQFEDVLPKLSEMGLQQLYPEFESEDTSDTNTNANKIQELHKLVKSLLVNFIELLGIMHIEPSEFHTKIEDLKVILININHILNSYRRHQSRESLIMLLRQRIDDKKQEMSSIDTKMKQVQTKLEDLVKFDEIKLTDVVKKGDEQEDIKDEIMKKLLKDI